MQKKSRRMLNGIRSSLTQTKIIKGVNIEKRRKN